MEGRIEFVVFCIENVALSLHMDPSEVCSALAENSDILTAYLLPNYEALHTQGKDYIVADIIDVMRERGLCA